MASIIKATGARRLADGGAFNLADLSDKAEQWLVQVRRDAAEILARAEKDAAAIRAKAEEQGKQAALKAAERVLEEKVSKQLDTLLPALKQAIAGIGEARAAFLAGWERNTIHLAAAIAGRVIRRELSREPEISLALVREALELAAGSPQVQLALHPDDRAALAPHVERLTREMTRLGQVEIVADPQVARGGCRVSTRQGTIDEQIATQLARIEEELSAP